MPRKYLIVLFFMAFVGARHALAQAPETECPPECVTDSLEIITYYPSPYGYYEELRGDKIIVGDTDNSHIDETHLPPSGTITFEPKSYAQISTSGTLYESTIYYDSFDHEFKYYDNNSSWQPLGGGGGGGLISDTIVYSLPGNSMLMGYAPIEIKGFTYYAQLYIDGNSQLIGGAHSLSDCINASGTPYDAGSQQYICKFNQSSCPSGWAPYNLWSSTQAVTCTGQCSCSANCGHGCNGGPPSCTTSFHSFQNLGVETCVYDRVYNNWVSYASFYPTTCSAAITQSGCR